MTTSSNGHVADVVEGVVEARNERGVKVGGDWRNVSKFHPVDMPPQGARVRLDLDAKGFIRSVQVQSVLDVVRWQAQQSVVGPAQAALREARGRMLRDDPEWVVGRLAGVEIEGLPEDLARQVFGVWSNACWRLVQQRGWCEPRRYSPATSRGAVLARRTPEGPDEVLSALGMGPDWRVGDIVTDMRIHRAARPLQAR